MPPMIDADTPDADVSPTIIPQDQLPASTRQPQASSVQDQQIIQNPSSDSPFFKDITSKLKQALDPSAPALDKPATPSPTPKPADKPATTTAPAPADKPDDDLPFTRAKAEDWKAIKTRLKEAQTVAEERAKKLEEIEKLNLDLKSKADLATKAEESRIDLEKQFESIRQEREKLSDQLKTVALEQSEEFNRKYNQIFQASTNTIKEVAADKADTIISIMQLPRSEFKRSKIVEITSSMDPLTSRTIHDAVVDYEKAAVERASELKNSKDNYQKMLQIRAQRENQMREMQEATNQKLIAEALSKAKSFESFKVSTDDAHNASVKANELLLQRYFKGELDPETLMMMPVKAAESERLSKVIPALEAKIKELESVVSQYKSASPGVAANQKPSTPPNQARVEADQFANRPNLFLKAFNDAMNT